MKRKHLKLLISIIFFISLIIYRQFAKPNDSPVSTYPTTSNLPADSVGHQALATTSAEFALVKRVIDGDTIELDSGKKVRYIGINSPEISSSQKTAQCFAEEAKNINQKLVEGKTVRLEKDISEVDKYNRLLRYVFLPEEKNATSGGIFVNQYLVENGYAYAATYPPDVKYAEVFKQKQREAQNNRQGLWEKCSK